MATTIDRYAIQVDTKSAESSLKGLASEVAKLGSAFVGFQAFKGLVNVSKTFEDLRSSLKSLYGTSSEANAVFADIQDFAKKSVFSVADLTATVIKLKAAGLEPTIAQLRFFANVSSVAADSLGALQAITDLYARTTEGGLGLEDLNRLADRGIPVFKVLGEQLGLSRLEIAKLGQTSEGAQLILKALENGLGATFSTASQDKAKNLSQAMSNFNDTLANLADVVGKTGLTQGLASLINAFGAFLESLRPIAALVGIALGGAFELLGKNIAIVSGAVITFVGTLTVASLLGMINGVLKLSGAFNILNAVVGKNPLVKLALIAAGVGASLFAASEAIDQNKGKINELDAELAKFGQNEGAKGLEEGKIANGLKNLKDQVGPLNQELKKFSVEIKAIGDSFAANNQSTIESIGLETRLLGAKKLDADIERARAEMTKRTADEVRNLQEKKDKLTKAELAEGRGRVIDDQIARIKALGQADMQRQEEALLIQNRISRDFNTGWAQAFNEYVDNATNAAKQAQQIFQTLAQGLEDSLVNAFKTGKFEWKNFLNSIVEELLRSQIRQTIASVFSVGSGGNSGSNSFWSGLSSLLGFASGGIIPTNGPVIVGERGPELLMGAAGRSVIPNNALGGSTSVIYNINAVDALSFKSLVARDPGFIHAVAMQGAGGVPRR